MAWQDRLVPASFRGIPFKIESHDFQGGRRSISHEPLERDQNFTEDLGGKSSKFFITGFLLGDDYFFLRDALIDAMERPEAGTLFHPYLGLKEVQPGGFSLRETIEEGRICRFDLEFTEAGDPSAVFETIDRITSFINAGVAAVAQINNAVNVAVAIAGLPAFAFNSAEALVNNFGSNLLNSLSAVKTNLDRLATVTFQVNFLDTVASTLLSGGTVQTGEKFGDLGEVTGVEGLAEMTNAILNGAVEAVEDDAEAEDDAIDDSSGRDSKTSFINAIIDSADEQQAENDEIPTETATRKQEKLNNDSLNAAIKRQAIVALATRAADRSFQSEAQAIAERERINALITEQTELVLEDRNGEDVFVEDEFFQSFKDLLAATSAIVPDPTRVLGQVKTINVPTDVPALVVSYNQYGNVDREKDIIDRNVIKNPCFVSGDLEVVVNG
jgi:prophage DNA circulation protein